ncbi:MAG: hypothetical protein ACR2MY_14030 [Candidatus Dormibacteria bacterium]
MSDAQGTLAQYQAGQLASNLFLQRLQADYAQIALTDQGFITELGTIPFPAATHADLATLVAAVQRHRNACQAVSSVGLPDLGAAIQRAADSNGDESAAVELVRSDLAPAATPQPSSATPGPSPS